MIILKNKLLKWQHGARGPRTLGQPWAPQHGDPALCVCVYIFKPSFAEFIFPTCFYRSPLSKVIRQIQS